MSFLSFVIPSLGRPTLGRTLESLKAQTHPDWEAVVVGDGEVSLPPSPDSRIRLCRLSRRLGSDHASGHVRNEGCRWVSGEWFGFVDDDDTLDPHYVEWLREESAGMDLVIFKMIYPDGHILPPDRGPLRPGGVGISFSVRSQFYRDRTLSFGNSTIEDWSFLTAAIEVGARWKFSDRIAYYVNH